MYTAQDVTDFLKDYDVRIEVFHRKGMIDRDEKVVYVNPVIGSRTETLAHEGLHGLMPSATEDEVKRAAEYMVTDPSNRDHLENYLQNHGRVIPTRGVYGTLGFF